jgi:hypothetical protein
MGENDPVSDDVRLINMVRDGVRVGDLVRLYIGDGGGVHEYVSVGVRESLPVRDGDTNRD